MSEIITIANRISRDTDSMPCPSIRDGKPCNGFADRVDLTPDEIKNQGCGRTYECCGRAFLCRICNTRIVGKAEAPEMD